jgi:hypothetical protein
MGQKLSKRVFSYSLIYKFGSFKYILCYVATKQMLETAVRCALDNAKSRNSCEKKQRAASRK